MGRRAPRSVALAFEDAAVQGAPHQRRGQQVEGDLVLAHVDVLAPAGAPPVLQGGGQGRDGEPRADEVRQHLVGTAGRPLGEAGDVVQTRQRLEKMAQAWMPGPGSCLPLHRKGQHDQARLGPGQLRVAQPHPVHDAGAEVLHDDIGPGRQLSGEVPGLGTPQVQGDTELREVMVGEHARRVLSRLGVQVGAGHARSVGPPGRLDLDHPRAVHRQVLGGHRPDDGPGEVQDVESREGKAGEGKAFVAAGHGYIAPVALSVTSS